MVNPSHSLFCSNSHSFQPKSHQFIKPSTIVGIALGALGLLAAHFFNEKEPALAGGLRIAVGGIGLIWLLSKIIGSNAFKNGFKKNPSHHVVPVPYVQAPHVGFPAPFVSHVPATVTPAPYVQPPYVGFPTPFVSHVPTTVTPAPYVQRPQVGFPAPFGLQVQKTVKPAPFTQTPAPFIHQEQGDNSARSNMNQAPAYRQSAHSHSQVTPLANNNFNKVMFPAAASR